MRGSTVLGLAGYARGVALRGRSGSLAEQIARRVGLRKTFKVLLFITAWGVVYEDLGRAPVSIEEYSDWWKASRAKSFREQQLFREALPNEDTPTRLYELARVHVDVHNPAAAVLLGALIL